MRVNLSQSIFIICIQASIFLLGCGTSADSTSDNQSTKSLEAPPSSNSSEDAERLEQSEPNQTAEQQSEITPQEKQPTKIETLKRDVAKKTSHPVASNNSTASTQPTTQPSNSPKKPIETSAKKQEVTVTEKAVPVAAAKNLEDQVSNFKVPPDWLSSVTTNWDVANKPWKEGRIEIRRLLGKNDKASQREAIKLTWDYLQKNDIGNRHEYGMYMFLGNEPIWAIIAYREYVKRTDLKYPPYHGLNALASLYADYGEFEEAEKMLLKGLTLRPPDLKWAEMRKAEMHNSLGDLYANWGKLDKAKENYREAIRLYPLGKPPYGRHLLPRRAKKVQSKLDLLSQASLATATLRDGVYRETALGYSGDIRLTVNVSNGHIAKIDINHQEKIEQNATKIIPARIIAEQSLQVDGVSGATVTKDAIVGGTLRALRKAGLK